MSSRDPSLYSTLKVAAAEIRVLHLLPGNTRDPIRTAIRTVSLDDTPQFEALSYVWGSPRDKKQIYVEDQIFDVTINLEAALRALRHPEETLRIWVDAICINQVDLDEKSTQVPLMGRIYKQASSVLIWLGENTLNIDRMMVWLPILRSPKGAQREREMKRLERIELIRMYCGLLDLITRPYWLRMWTYQEFALPERLPIAVCGRHRFSTDDLGKALQQHEVKHFHITENDFLDPLVGMSRSCFSKENLPQVISGGVVLQQRRVPESRTWSLCFSFSLARRRCENPRDSIYATYGLFPKIQESVVPNYNKSPECVMHEMTVWAITHDLDSFCYLLNVVSFYPNRDRRLDVPSWTLDFGKQSTEVDHKYQYTVSFRFSGTALGGTSMRVSEDLKTLHMQVRSLGRCRIVLRFEEDEDLLVRQVHELLGLDRDEEHCLTEQEQHRYETLAVIVTAHSMGLRMMGWNRTRTTLKEPDTPISGSIKKDFYRRLRGKTLIEIPSLDQFGVTVADVSEDDIIVVSRELGIPAVLRLEQDEPQRPKEQDNEGPVEALTSNIEKSTASRTITADHNRLSSGSNGGSYRLIGLAYVDGITRNEDKARSKVEELSVQDFVVH